MNDCNQDQNQTDEEILRDKVSDNPHHALLWPWRGRRHARFHSRLRLLLLDRGWGKATQLTEHTGEIRQLIEVKLNVVQAVANTLPGERVLELEANDIK